MRNLRALIVCAFSAMLVSSALWAADGEEADVAAQIKELTMKVNQLTSAKDGGAGLGANKLPFVIDGHVDVTGNFNFNGSPNRTNVGRHYDTNANTFILNVAHVAIHRDAQKGSIVGFNIEIDLGQDARHNNATKVNSPASSTNDLVDLQEAWIKILAPNHENCGVQVGKFATWQGIEVIESTGNPVISRGFLFMFAEPLNHVGINAFYTHDMGNGMMFDIRFGAVNGWDSEIDNNKEKTFIWYFGVKKEGVFEAHLNGTWGDEQAGSSGDPRTSVDLTGSVQTPDGMVVVFFQLNHGSEKEALAGAEWVHWFGLALEPVIDLKKQLPGFKLAGRFELFDDHDGARINALGTNEPATVWNVTLCPSYAITDNCTVRFEYRYDWSNLNRGQNARAFEDEDGNDDLNHQNTVMVQLLYTFSTEMAN